MLLRNNYFMPFRTYLTFSHRFNVGLLTNSSKHLSTNAEYDVIDNIFPDVEGTPKPVPPNILKFRDKKTKKVKSIAPSVENVNKSGHVVIECKNKEVNHYINQKYGKLEVIPLASKGWQHRLSRGDFFKINIYPDKEKRENVFWSEGFDSFEGLGLNENIIQAVNKMGITRPTSIQAQGIQTVLNNQNTLLAGETGCGKTLAYLLPVVQQILEWRTTGPQRKLNAPLALILVPGRELTYQIADVADQLAKELLFDLEVVVGGHTKRLMTHPDFRPVDLFILSTGAASKLTTSGVYNMSYVRHIVLDEADTLLDDSFNPLITRFLKKFPLGYSKPARIATGLPEFCQLTLASATMPTSVAPILGNIILPESLVRVETPRLHHVLVQVPQLFLRLKQSEKPTRLLELVKKHVTHQLPTIIFSNRSKVCDWISMFLNENGVNCVNLNGDMPVDIRAGRFDHFQRGIVDVISCTDMASRGLDTIRAKRVLNYDFPVYMADYIHRCGRVGRVGHTEDRLITNFVCTEQEVELTRKIETAVRTMSPLPNVNANITRIIHAKIMKSM